MPPLLPSIVLGLLLIGETAAAAPTHHWRFESAPGFLSDSIGAATLTAIDAPTQVSIPATGRGSEFDAIAGNAQAADLDGTDAFSTPISITDDFTIEVLLHLDADPNIFGYGFAGFATGDAPNQVGWVLQTRQPSNPGPDQLRLATGYSNSLTFFNSMIPLVAGKDYYIAVTFDSHDDGATARFRVLNLTDGGPPQTASVHIGSPVFVGLNPIDTFVIGDDVNSTSRLDGLIDEVRLSDSVLPAYQLLIPEPVPALGSGALGVLAVLLVTTGIATSRRMLRRRHT